MTPSVAVFGGGCFWCTEAVFKMLRGVSSVLPGYAGGTVPNPTYAQVRDGNTGHAECVKIEYDATQVSYRSLLTVFFGSHDPSTRNQQGADVGTQYRSIIFTTTPDQAAEAKAFIAEINASNEAGKPIVTDVESLAVAPSPAQFWVAENYHQDYVARNPGNPYCELVINPKLEKVTAQFAELLVGKQPLPKTEVEWKSKLTPEQYKVLREKGTEAPFSGKLLHADKEGVYRCAACGNALYSSDAKFDSGTGWPSFDQALPGAIREVPDDSHGMRRVETVCANCGSHLGHVFDDGPTATGKRYCMNSVCLDLEEKK